MIKWNFEALEMLGAYKITPFFADDIRGGFIKDYSREIFAQNGIEYNLEEVFYTISHKGVVRAMHFQITKQQAKLVRCVSGKVYDVIIDLRKESPTFMNWQGFYLSGENMIELLIPEGFGHGYLVLEDSIVSYKCAEKFYGEYDSGVKFDDPALGIVWPFEEVGGRENIILADKDKNLPDFKEFMQNYDNFLK